MFTFTKSLPGFPSTFISIEFPVSANLISEAIEFLESSTFNSRLLGLYTVFGDIL